MRGVVRTFGEFELAEYQGIEYSPTGYENPDTTITVLVLNEPADLVGHATSNLQGYVNFRPVTLIRLSKDEAGGPYEGKEVTLEYDQDKMWWPSGTDLPLGQPYVAEYTILP
ncbi:hypothetical protein CPHO_02045 [Corynebacterium phocae]|uniref:Uncharacterized protein n=1 Tax=Corynebacterium phocae TaxID=161895 RepID=A0A1L7D1D3_9CORY|nr:hypothetical protein CPHO_02045 [Corynebacterium phocae]